MQMNNIVKMGGNENYTKFSKRKGKLPLPRWKHIIHPVVHIYGQGYHPMIRPFILSTSSREIFVILYKTRLVLEKATTNHYGQATWSLPPFKDGQPKIIHSMEHYQRKFIDELLHERGPHPYIYCLRYLSQRWPTSCDCYIYFGNTNEEI